MNHVYSFARTRVVVSVLTVFVTAGCNLATKRAPISRKACKDYATRMCEESGKTSKLCKSIRDDTRLLPTKACAVAWAEVATAVATFKEKRKDCLAIKTKVCSEIGEDTDSCTWIKEMTQDELPEKCKAKMAKVPEILAMLTRDEQFRVPIKPAKLAELLKDGAPSLGAADAKVTVVVFSDFKSPLSLQAAGALRAVKEKHGAHVRMVFHTFPQSTQEEAHLSAQASLAAHAQGKFWEYHDKLFANQDKLDRPALEGYAKELGLNLETFKKALDDKTYASTVDQDIKLGEAFAVESTPTVFVNGYRVRNPVDSENMVGHVGGFLDTEPSGS